MTFSNQKVECSFEGIVFSLIVDEYVGLLITAEGQSPIYIPLESLGDVRDLSKMLTAMTDSLGNLLDVNSATPQ